MYFIVTKSFTHQNSTTGKLEVIEDQTLVIPTILNPLVFQTLAFEDDQNAHFLQKRVIEANPDWFRAISETELMNRITCSKIVHQVLRHHDAGLAPLEIAQKIYDLDLIGEGFLDVDCTLTPQEKCDLLKETSLDSCDEDEDAVEEEWDENLDYDIEYDMEDELSDFDEAAGCYEGCQSSLDCCENVISDEELEAALRTWHRDNHTRASRELDAIKTEILQVKNKLGRLLSTRSQHAPTCQCHPHQHCTQPCDRLK
jgi:hypothetical protein